jgi:predicted ATPase
MIAGLTRDGGASSPGVEFGQITEEEVKRALGRFRATGDLASSPLRDLDLVSRRLTHSGVGSTPGARGWALGETLHEIVLSQLTTLRGARSSPRKRDSVAESTWAALRDDFAAGNVDRESWSALYYRYLALQPLQVQELAAILFPRSAHGRRTVGRRLARGYTLLTNALRDLEREALREQPRAASAIAPVHANLPLPLSRFIGRQGDLAEVCQLVGAHRLVTLLGAGGIGKSRLAMEAATLLAPRFPDGVWYVDLAGVSEPALLDQAVATALGVRETGAVPLRSTLVAQLADRHSLIVLDNCEHVVVALVDLAEHILANVASARLLATSREVLRVSGELQWQVPPLSMPADPPGGAAPVDLAALAASEAVALFLDRAGNLSPGYVLTDENAAVIASICRRLEGLPLAIELAVMRLRLLSAEEVESRLADRFELLKSGGRGLPRHETLRAAVDASYELLDAAQRSLFSRLAVFRGGFTLEAAEQVAALGGAGADTILDLVGGLVDKSLVQVRPFPGATRYAMLDTLREYALEKLDDSGELDVVSYRHATWCLALAEAGRDARTGGEQAAWLARLAAERENLRAALGWLDQRPELAALSLELAGALHRYWQMQGHLSEGLWWLERALARPEAAAPTVARARALAGAGDLALRLGRLNEAESYLTHSVGIWRTAGDPSGEADAIRRLGSLADIRGDTPRAKACYEEALAICEDIGDTWGAAATLNNRGLLARKEGDLGAAQACLREGLSLFQELGADWAVGVTLSNLGDIALDLGDPESASLHYAESLEIARKLAEPQGVAYGFEGLANVARVQGRFADAWQALASSLAALRATDDRIEMADWLETAVLLAHAEGDARAVARLMGAAAGLRARIDAPTPASVLPALEEAARERRAELGAAKYDEAHRAGLADGWERVAEETVAAKTS